MDAMTPLTPKSASSASSDSTDLEDDPDVAVVEMLIEPYFMQVGSLISWRCVAEGVGSLRSISCCCCGGKCSWGHT
jgi:hypothetical protein